MKSVRQMTIPVGLSGVMDYSHIKAGSYKVENLKEGIECFVVVEQADSEKMVVHFDITDEYADGFEKSPIAWLLCIENAGIIEKAIYFK